LGSGLLLRNNKEGDVAKACFLFSRAVFKQGGHGGHVGEASQGGTACRTGKAKGWWGARGVSMLTIPGGPRSNYKECFLLAREKNQNRIGRFVLKKSESQSAYRKERLVHRSLERSKLTEYWLGRRRRSNDRLRFQIHEWQRRLEVHRKYGAELGLNSGFEFRPHGGPKSPVVKEKTGGLADLKKAKMGPDREKKMALLWESRGQM